MTRVEIEKELLKASGGARMISVSELAEKYFGLTRKAPVVMDAVRGLLKIGSKYSVYDVSQRLYQMQK